MNCQETTSPYPKSIKIQKHLSILKVGNIISFILPTKNFKEILKNGQRPSNFQNRKF